MNVTTAGPATVEIKRSRLLGLVACAAALASAITWAVIAYAVGGAEGHNAAAQPARVSSVIQSNIVSTLSPQERSYLQTLAVVCSVVVCPPNERLAAQLGYVARGVSAPTSAVSSLDSKERHYLKSMSAVCSVVMCEPNEQFAARLGIGR